ncbi:MAG: hypothetical protein E6I87_12545 [Chloroflexi bacterium]|nr:MAG: hypothetical protein E6I87_12545 [Chloroflexota bacterium]
MAQLRMVLLAALLIAGACGSAAGGDPSPTIGTSVVVTMASDRQTVTAHVGDHIQIALGDTYSWQLDPPDGVVLVHPLQNYMLVRGTQAIWLAGTAGRSALHATGTAVCASGQPCPMFAVLFSADVIVLP